MLWREGSRILGMLPVLPWAGKRADRSIPLHPVFPLFLEIPVCAYLPSPQFRDANLPDFSSWWRLDKIGNPETTRRRRCLLYTCISSSSNSHSCESFLMNVSRPLSTGPLYCQGVPCAQGAKKTNMNASFVPTNVLIGPAERKMLTSFFFNNGNLWGAMKPAPI